MYVEFKCRCHVLYWWMFSLQYLRNVLPPRSSHCREQQCPSSMLQTCCSFSSDFWGSALTLWHSLPNTSTQLEVKLRKAVVKCIIAYNLLLLVPFFFHDTIFWLMVSSFGTELRWPEDKQVDYIYHITCYYVSYREKVTISSFGCPCHILQQNKKKCRGGLTVKKKKKEIWLLKITFKYCINCDKN